MLQKINTFFFKTSWAEKKILLKDNLFTPGDENILRVIRSIKKINPNSKNTTIIDIGAFNGETSVQFAKAFPQSNILAFEANPETFPIAKKNCDRYKNITVLNHALSDKNEVLDFHITNNSVSSSLNELYDTADYHDELKIKNKVQVDAKTLDEFSDLENILLIKIDTQGHELHVINGAVKTLKKTDFVLVEMANHSLYKSGCQYYEVDEALRKNNFELLDIIVTYRKNGMEVSEYDAVYINKHKI